MLNKFMLSLALSATFLISIQAVEAMDGEVEKENLPHALPKDNSDASQSDPKDWVVQPPKEKEKRDCKYWVRQAIKNPEKVKFVNGELILLQ